MSSPRSHHRTSLAIGWEAARANLVPALVIQALMLGLLVGYYLSSTVGRLINEVAAYRARYGFLFVLLAAAAAGAILPEIFLIVFFQRGRPTRQNLRNLCFTVPTWTIDGLFVDLLYRSEAAWLGDTVTLPVVAGKIGLDQFGYNPLFAAPFGVLIYEWKNSGFSTESLRRSFTWDHYRDKIIPTLLATWAFWIPLMAIIYSLPLALQFPIFCLALTLWVLLLTYMTNTFAVRQRDASRLASAVPSAVIRTS
jgi:hypothetical protein